MPPIVRRTARPASACAAIAAIFFHFSAALHAADTPPTAERLHKLFADEWEYSLREHPEFASSLGDKRYNDRWTDLSADAIRRRHEHDVSMLATLDALDAKSLPAGDRLNYRLFRDQYSRNVETYPFGSHVLAISQMGGIQSTNELADALVFNGTKDYEDWLARLRSLPARIDQTIALLREGMKTRMTYPRIIMARVPAQIEKQVVEDPEKSPFFKPFTRFAGGVPEADRARLTRDARAAIADGVVPAYRRLHRCFVDEYLPACGEDIGASHWPRGREYYATRVRHSTTTQLTPEQVHAIGLEEVARIEKQMLAILQELKYQGTLAQFNEHLRNDPRNHFTTPDEVLLSYRAVCKQIEPRLLRLFGRLPRMPYGVEAIPELTAADAPAAFYRSPAADGTRAGFFMVNTYQPEARLRHEIVALALHEAVPGHHLQIALAQELGDLPTFRRHQDYTAFAEGWGLYAEHLGYELDMYADAYSRYGQLTYEMWRAARLVVDTGLHAKDWTRRQAIDYFKAQLAKSELDITNEIDRYIVWPGQAVAYKIGELKFRELRRRAEKKLGGRFDVRAFHDMLLSNGAVPLDVLEQVVDEWIDGKAGTAAPR